MPAAPVCSATLVMWTEWAVSLLPDPAMTGTVTASATQRQRSAFSPSVRTGDSPVVPATTRPSLPWSTNHRARVAAPSKSRSPSSSNGVAIAGRTGPKVADVFIWSLAGARSCVRCRPLETERGDEVLVHLHPNVVVTVVERLGHAVVIARLDGDQAGVEARPIRCQTGQQRAHLGTERLDAVVHRPQLGDHRPVVGGVGVVVGR